MLRSINPDAENVAPSGAPLSTSRKSGRRPLGLRTTGQDNAPVKQFASKPSAKQPPRRRALGDITNKGSATAVLPKAAPAKTMPLAARVVSQGADGEIEEPDIVPEAPVYEAYEPVLEFDEKEMAEWARLREEREGGMIKEWAKRVDEFQYALPDVNIPIFEDEEEEEAKLEVDAVEGMPLNRDALLGDEGFEALELS